VNVNNSLCCGPFFNVDWSHVQAIYLDDQMSGWGIESNGIYNSSVGILVGGGRRNILTKNTFKGNGLPVYFDNRGMNWQNAMCIPGGLLEDRLEAVDYTSKVWSAAYPELVNIMNDHPCVPVYNVFQGNSYCPQNKSTPFIDQDQSTIEKWMSTSIDNSLKC